ncbi:isoamyl acetate-hydrolyzing esterase-like protein [Leptotrombidium deliense]|uniref:Isoamyl acetate-hydrolyzing esterase-like protein n=1 Tax=Leptotrombidium deliense TaxID=299467 RepID=A0A443RZY9_9ACAR|nr:isoamyl acetate-hydrolyzing esterase-like protein [Leptotrombidium deliense]
MSTFAKNTKIVLFGDSLTELHVFCSNHLMSAVVVGPQCLPIIFKDVICRGFSGYNTTHLKIILPQILQELVIDEVSVFVLFLGANDCNHDIEQFVDLPKFNENYREILNTLKNNGFDSKKLLLITPPVYNHDKYSEYCLQTGRAVPQRNIEYVKTYVNEVENIAHSENLKLVNIFEKMYAQQNWSDLLRDGLHLSSSGAQLLFESILPDISDRVLSHRGTLNKRFVDWKEIDLKCPESSLNM